MKRVVPIVVSATFIAAAVAAAVVKSREGGPHPETPEGSWELDEHGAEA